MLGWIFVAQICMAHGMGILRAMPVRPPAHCFLKAYGPYRTEDECLRDGRAMPVNRIKINHCLRLEQPLSDDGHYEDRVVKVPFPRTTSTRPLLPQATEQQAATWPCSKSEFSSLILKAIQTGQKAIRKGWESHSLVQMPDKSNPLTFRSFIVFGRNPLNRNDFIRAVKMVSRNFPDVYSDSWVWTVELNGKMMEMTHHHLEVHGRGSNTSSHSYTDTFMSSKNAEGIALWHRFLAHWCGVSRLIQ